MLSGRKVAFDTISRVLALTRLDIEQHQVISDFSLNIHGENWVRDIFNFIYECNFKNANSTYANTPFIDLIDENKKRLIQVTTTRSKKKILHSLKALKNPKYKDYDISIYYLIDKASPTKATKKEIESIYPELNLEKILRDYTDLILDINDLNETSLIGLADKYFSIHKEKYTDIKVLDLVYSALLERKAKTYPNYDDDLGSLETTKKLILNDINERFTSQINKSLDYTTVVGQIDDGQLGTDLRRVIIDDLYRSILISQLTSKVEKSVLTIETVSKLQQRAIENKLDFNKLIDLLVKEVDGLLIITDFNSMEISWILVSYFFEICDIGVKEK